MLRKSLISLFILVLGAFPACESEDWILEVDCNDCFNNRPDSALIIVKLSINEENPAIPLVIYQGEAGGTVDWVDTALTNDYYLSARVGSYYTVRAEYKKGDQTIMAYDGDEMVLKDYGDECGDPCFIIKGGIYDLRLLE